MANNNDGQIVLGLDIPKTVKQINADIKSLQNQLAQVKATGALDTSATVKQINAQITALQSQLKTIDIKANINTTDAQKTGQKAGQAVADAAQKAIDNKNINIDKLNADVKTLVNNLNSFSSKNAGFDSFLRVKSSLPKSIYLSEPLARFFQINFKKQLTQKPKCAAALVTDLIKR